MAKSRPKSTKPSRPASAASRTTGVRRPASKRKTESKLRENTKQARLIAMLRASEGATIGKIATALGWQRHTVRGAIAGALKKKLGLTIRSEKSADGERVYRIV